MSKTGDYTPLQMAGFLLGYIAGSDEPDALLVAGWLRDWQAEVTPASSRFLDLDAPATVERLANGLQTDAVDWGRYMSPEEGRAFARAIIKAIRAERVNR